MCRIHFFLLASFLFSHIVFCDVVHFLPPPVLLEAPQSLNGFSYLDSEWNNNNNNAWQTVDPSTAAPAFVESTTRFSLPEIIINKSGGGRYPSEVPHNHHEDSVVVQSQYLPPTPVTTSSTTTTQSPPLQDEINYYIPPSSQSPTSERNPNNGRNLYYYPRPPIQFDEPFIEPILTPTPTTQPPQYLPPPPVAPPLNAYLPPFAASTRVANNRSDNDFFSISNRSKSPLRLEMTEMKCLNNGADGFFRTRITVQSFINTIPVFEDAASAGCSNNRLEISRNEIRIQIPASEFKSCGVASCGQKNDELCARIRFPQIRGMRTVNDAILALQCKPQEKIISKTHALKMGVSSESHARSVGAVAQGGGGSKFRTQVAIFRRNGDSFLQPLEAKGVVQLGEDLLMRMQTRQGDGWNYTKITDIKMQRLANTGEVVNSVSLVSNNGCLNPAMTSVCTIPPQFEPPFGQKFGFRAVMFQGMRRGEEVIMSIRLIGCVNRVDCETSDDQCSIAGKTVGRTRRSAEKEAENVEVTQISFRVADPHEHDREVQELHARSLVITWSCVGIGLGFLGLLIFCFIVVYHFRERVQEKR